jgi:hypothetical protein
MKKRRDDRASFIGFDEPEIFDEYQVSSGTEFTGMIPRAVQSNSEAEAYNDLYGATVVPKRKEKRT